MGEYSVGELVHSGDLYDYFNKFDFDLDFYKQKALSVKGSVLELCCGTGRLTIPLYRSGVDITGLDISVSMLKKAKEKMLKKNLNINFIEADMKNFNLNKKFSLIFIPFNSLQNTYSISDVESIFTQIRNHLTSDGLFIFDIFNPNIYYMVDREKSFVEHYRFFIEDNVEVVISEKCKYDSAGQVNRVQWLYKIGNKESIEKLDMRCFYPLEMDVLLKYNNFEVLNKFGDFKENIFDTDSKKQIYICKVNK